MTLISPALRWASLLSLVVCCGLTGAPALAAGDDVEIVTIDPMVERPDRALIPPPEELSAATLQRANAFRKEQRQPPIEPHPALTRAAEAFARYMAETGRYGHTADDREPGDRVAVEGYDFALVTENIAWRFDSNGYGGSDALAGAFMQGWIDSPGHRKNLVDADVVHTGIGYAISADGAVFGVQLFARPKAMRFEFQIRNDTAREIRYRLDDQAYELPPRARRLHGVARPPKLEIEGLTRGPISPAPPGVQVKPGTLLIVTEPAEGKLAVRAQPAPPAPQPNRGAR